MHRPTLIPLLFSLAAIGAPVARSDPCELLRFRSYIVGHFTNAAQHAAKGDDHPFAEHISDVANQKVFNAPAGFFDDDRFFDLEESFFTTVDANGTASTVTKPMIFLFKLDEGGSVQMTSYLPPDGVSDSDLRNNNTALRLDYTKMKISPSFNPASYKYDERSKSYHLQSATPIQGGYFNLTETISDNHLEVLEDVIIDGKSVMPYHTPLLYDRI